MTISHTEDTKEMTVENLLKDIDYWKSQERNGHSFEEMNKAVEALKECVRTTLTLYASQVREERLREEIVKLEGMKYTFKSVDWGDGIISQEPVEDENVSRAAAEGNNRVLQTIIDRYLSELTTLTPKI